jgi:hypothetical protein
LSRREGWAKEVAFSLLSIPTPNWIDKLKEQYQEDKELSSLFARWQSNTLNSSKYAVRDSLLLYKNRLYLGSCSPLRSKCWLLFIVILWQAIQVMKEQCKGKEGFFLEGNEKEIEAVYQGV